jgi:hypothetical protein
LTTATDDPLLLALDRLTIDHTVRVPVEDGPDYIATHKGLIVQLREAVASDLGGGGGAGASASERVPLDADALVKYQQIEEAISARHHSLVGGPSGRYPENDLRWWYAAFMKALQAGTKLEADYTYELRTLQTWERIILAKFDPPRKREMAGEKCPECGFDFYIDNTDKADPQRKVALTITYPEGDLEASEATCGCCKKQWHGLLGLRELSYSIEEHDTPGTNITNEVVRATNT